MHAFPSLRACWLGFLAANKTCAAVLGPFIEPYLKHIQPTRTAISSANMHRESWSQRLDELIAENRSTAAEKTAADVIQSLGTHTVSAAILHEGSITSHCITGGSNDTDTLFQACSISKPIVALVVFRLAEQGLIDLDASIDTYLHASDVSALETSGTKGLARSITTAHLLSHTSGLGNCGSFGFPGYSPADERPYSLPSIREILAGTGTSNTLPIKLQDWPGHRFNYSGGGITVVQLILETVTGQTLPEILKAQVFEPLGLQRTTFASPTPQDFNDYITPGRQGTRNYARTYCNGHTTCDVTHTINPEHAAAGLWSTPKELLQIVHAVSRALEGEPDSSLSRAGAKRMLSEVQNGMAHGWFVDEVGFRHAGSNMPGWRCNMVGFWPTRSASGTVGHRGVVIMTNSREGTLVYDKILRAIGYIFLWPSVLPATVFDEDVVIALADTKAPHRSSESLTAWNGFWTSSDKQGPRAVFELSANDDRLMLRLLPHKQLNALYLASHVSPTLTTVQGSVVEDLVCCGGIQMLVRLALRMDGEKVIELWNGNTRDKQLLQRV